MHWLAPAKLRECECTVSVIVSVSVNWRDGTMGNLRKS